MKKSELKTGMKVVTRDGGDYVVLMGTEHGDVLLSNRTHSWVMLSHYNEEIHNPLSSKYDVVRVYNPEHVFAIGNFLGQKYGDPSSFYLRWNLVWQEGNLVDDFITKLSLLGFGAYKTDNDSVDAVYHDQYPSLTVVATKISKMAVDFSFDIDLISENGAIRVLFMNIRK